MQAKKKKKKNTQQKGSIYILFSSMQVDPSKIMLQWSFYFSVVRYAYVSYRPYSSDNEKVDIIVYCLNIFLPLIKLFLISHDIFLSIPIHYFSCFFESCNHC